MCSPPPGSTFRPMPLAVCAALGLFAPSADAQSTPMFSIDWRSRSKALPAGGTGPLLNEGRILVASTGVPTVGPQPAPLSFLTPQQLGLPLAGNCTTQPPGVPCQIEVDALSCGGEARFTT